MLIQMVNEGFERVITEEIDFEFQARCKLKAFFWIFVGPQGEWCNNEDNKKVYFWFSSVSLQTYSVLTSFWWKTSVLYFPGIGNLKIKINDNQCTSLNFRIVRFLGAGSEIPTSQPKMLLSSMFLIHSLVGERKPVITKKYYCQQRVW